MVQTWSKLGTDFNRYIQKYRRFHNLPIQYVRAVEAHADSYPHIHIILQFPTSISVSDARYFDKILYSRWKQLWSFGLSDYQPPRSKRLPILYLIKYISKSNHTYKTLWKKLLQTSAPVTATSDSQQSHVTSVEHSSTVDIKFVTTDLLCKKHKIKQLTWSRGFKFPVLSGVRGVPIGQTLLTNVDN